MLPQPWETYTADTSIDLTKHHVPNTMLDKIAYYTVKSLRFPTDIFFQVCAHPPPLTGRHNRRLILRIVSSVFFSPTRFAEDNTNGGVCIFACHGLMGDGSSMVPITLLILFPPAFREDGVWTCYLERGPKRSSGVFFT